MPSTKSSTSGDASNLCIKLGQTKLDKITVRRGKRTAQGITKAAPPPPTAAVKPPVNKVSVFDAEFVDDYVYLKVKQDNNQPPVPTIEASIDDGKNAHKVIAVKSSVAAAKKTSTAKPSAVKSKKNDDKAAAILATVEQPPGMKPRKAIDDTTATPSPPPAKKSTSSPPKPKKRRYDDGGFVVEGEDSDSAGEDFEATPTPKTTRSRTAAAAAAGTCRGRKVGDGKPCNRKVSGGATHCFAHKKQEDGYLVN